MEEELYNRSESFDDIDENNPQSVNELNALQKILHVLKSFDKNSVKRIIKTVLTFYDIESSLVSSNEIKKGEGENKESKFSDIRELTAKEFLLQKEPSTDVERVACLAYYLTHYRDTPFFKTVDLSRLNTEAAQVKFSNAAKAVDNASRQSGFLVPATQGRKQISAIGELFVQALPDREAARELIKKAKPRKRSKKSNKKNE